VVGMITILDIPSNGFAVYPTVNMGKYGARWWYVGNSGIS